MKKSLFALALMAFCVTAHAETVAVRISGLVCDLCIAGIEKDLKGMPHVSDVVVAPRDGIVAVQTTGAVDESKIKRVLVEAGYAVHAFSHSATISVADIRHAPAAEASSLWKNGASEQQSVLAHAKNPNVCAERFKPADWQNQGFGGGASSFK